jgi:uncharacterized protein
MVNQSIAIKIVHDYLHEIRALGVSIRKAILFGSFARNQQHEWSDIDVALVADDFIGIAALDKDRFRLLHLLPKFINIETHTFPTIRFEKGDPFIEEIKKIGIEIN